MDVKLKGSNSDPQFVTGLGSLVPGEWTEFSEEQVALFEELHHKKISDVDFLDTRKTKTKKEDEE